MKVVGIAGQAGSGKNTLADYLIDKLNVETLQNWKQASFASSVKKCFCDYFDKDLDFIEQWKRNPEPPPGLLKPVRQSLQFIGDGFRQIKPDIWIETAFRFNEPPFILTDARYFNEAKAVCDHGGLNILIWREGFENDDPNPSEAQIKPLVDWCVKQQLDGVIASWGSIDVPNEAHLFDIFVRNEGDIDDLHVFADAVVLPYIKRFFSGYE